MQPLGGQRPRSGRESKGAAEERERADGRPTGLMGGACPWRPEHKGVARHVPAGHETG